MATETQKLTFEQFQEQYGHSNRAYEFWDGEARPKSVPTIIHGLLQIIVAELLKKAGFHPASEVDLRIVPHIVPRPDLIATKKLRLEKYPTQGWDVVVEILSDDDSFQNVKEHFQNYQASGFGQAYLVDPSDRSVSEWKDGGFTPVSRLAGVPTQEIWAELDRALES